MEIRTKPFMLTKLAERVRHDKLNWRRGIALPPRACRDRQIAATLKLPTDK
jgi:hypothetical protein